MVRVSHVKVSDPHPSSCAVASSGHVIVNLTSIASTGPLNPVVPRWAALLYVLARWCRVLEGTIECDMFLPIPSLISYSGVCVQFVLPSLF